MKSIFAHRGHSVARRPAHRRVRHLSPLERMERRVLLAADIVLDGGVLTVTGTEGNDVMSVARVGVDDVQVTVNDLTRRLDMDDIHTYGMLGLGGDDRLTKTGSIHVASAPGFNMNGGEGTDTVRGSGAELSIRNAEQIEDAAGRIVASSSTVGDRDIGVFGTSGNDVIGLTEFGGDGARLSINSTFLAYLHAGDYGAWTVFGRDGNDTVNVGLFFPEVTVDGEAGNDVVNKDASSSVGFEGGDGDDLLRAQGETFDEVPFFFGEGGNDTIEMTGQLRLDLTAVDDRGVGRFDDIENVTNAQGTVIGNFGNNRVVVRADDTAGVEVHGGDGDDTLVGGPGPDRLFGEAGHDTLFGNGANDLLDGGPGIDRLDGGPGDDTLLNGENNAGPQFFIETRKLNVFGTLGADTFSLVRVGIDDVRATVNGVSRTFDMDDFDTIEMAGGPGNDTMTLGNGVENVLMNGGTGDDRITGNDRGNEILGEAGNDTLDGAGAPDSVIGGPGSDTLTGGPGGGDLISGEDGNDTIFARDGAADFAVHGGPGFDRARVDPADPVDEVEQFLA